MHHVLPVFGQEAQRFLYPDQLGLVRLEEERELARSLRDPRLLRGALPVPQEDAAQLPGGGLRRGQVQGHVRQLPPVNDSSRSRPH